MSNELEEELEHETFLAEMDALVEQIVWALNTSPAETVLKFWFDIKDFGDEPAFTSVLFDKIVKETE